MSRIPAHRKSLISRLARAREGNVAIVFGASFFAIAGVAGAAIDYGRARAAKDRLQAALDAALLAGARAKAANQSDADSKVIQAFDGNWLPKSGGVAASLTHTIEASGKVAGSASAQVPTTLMGLLGQSQIEISVTSEVMFGPGNAEVVLVMDNTGSMAGAKLDNLRDSARTLVDTLMTSSGSGSGDGIKIGLVPFSQYVNVGTEYRNEPWMSVESDSTTTNNQCYDTYPNATSSNCRLLTATAYNDGVPYTYQYEQCDWNWGAAVQQCTPVTTTKTWNGCAGSRSHPLNTQSKVAAGSPIPGIMNASCTAPLTRLSTDKSDIKSKIDAMTAVGDTYIPAGLVWGWRVLDHESPFADGNNPASGKLVRKILVLMTDGANTRSPDYADGSHNGSDTPLANTLTTELCTKIKDAGITIYTIAYEVSDPTVQSLLSSCASGPPFYFSAATASELQSAFADVGQSLVAVRVAR